MIVIKRNGKKEEFNQDKITRAISLAFADIYENVDKNLMNTLSTKIVSTFDKRKNYTVEEIQDIVELTLMREGHYEVAKQYIRYRHEHKLARNKYADLMDIVSDKISAKNVQNQNANVDEHSFGGRMGEMSGAILKQYALDYCMSDKSKQNHLSNMIYIHDLDHYALGDHNCLSIPFDKLLEKGFTTRQTDVRPAGSVNTAMQLVAVIFQLQSLQQFGGVSATHLDWTMVPYVRKSFAKHYKDGLKYVDDFHINERNGKIDYEIEHMLSNAKEYSIEDSEYKSYSPKAYNYAIDMTIKEIHQAVEALYHNLNN